MKSTSHDNQEFEQQFDANSRLADSSRIADTHIRDVLMQVPVSIVVYKGPAFIVDMINQRALEMWGLTYDEVINKPLLEIWPELLGQDTEKILTRVYTTGKSHVANEVATKYAGNGKAHGRVFNFVLNPVHDLNGKVIGITSTCTDVTREVRTKKAIADTEKRYNKIMMQSPFAFAIFKGKDMVISLANDSMKQVLGKGNNIEGKPLLEVLPELVGQVFPGYLENVYTTGHPFHANEALCKLQRNGRIEDAYFNFVYQPYREVDESISGITVIAYEVTNEVLAKKLVEESEKRYKELIYASPVGIYTCDAEGEIEMYNDTAVRIWGRKPEPGKDKWCGSWKMYNPDGTFLPHDDCPMAILIKEGRNDSREIIVERPDGTKFSVIPYPRLVYDSNGKITGAINTVIDITPQVGALRKIEESEKHLAKLAAIIQFSEDAIISKTVEGIVTSWNPGAAKIFGYSDEEMIGQPITKIIPEDRLNEEPDILNRIQKGEVIEHFETKRLTKEGKLLDISVTISPMKDSQGKITGASKIARDITEAKKAEASLKESERQFRQIADSMPQIVWTATPDGHLDYYNRQWYEFTGFEEDYSDLSWVRILHPDDVQISVDKYHYSIKTGEPYHVEYRFADRNKRDTFRWFMGRANPVRDELGNIVKWFGTFTEIDDAKRIQQELELGKQRREDFIKMASHELKTPITTIKGYIQLVLNVVKDEEKEISPLLVKSSLLTMDKQVSRLTRLMSELLDLSRIEAGQLELRKESFSLNELVIEIVQDVLYTNNKFSINIFHDFECIVHADRDRIGQVLTNFLTNAIKYSPGADKIEVRIFRPEKGQAAVSVKDRGIGIAKEDQEKIFERYYRAEGKSEQTYPGFGVGLYIAGDIIQRHNGRIFVESEKGNGSTFSFTLPVETE